MAVRRCKFLLLIKLLKYGAGMLDIVTTRSHILKKKKKKRE